MPNKTVEHPLDQWVSDVDRSISGALTEPFRQLQEQLDQIQATVTEIAQEEGDKVDRRSTLVLLGLLVGGLAWIQVGYPLVKGTTEAVTQAVEQTQNLVQKTITAITAPNAKVSEVALALVGQDFNPGQTEQCAMFVRHVLAQSGLKVGVTKEPFDKQYDTNEAIANSFFGADIGELITDKSQLKPGDLVAYGGTYNGYPATTITHVAIYVGNNEIVDRPTASKPVQKRSIDTFEHFVVGVRVRGQ
jgi:cell wall-associated NlpC family hydrolase